MMRKVLPTLLLCVISAIATAQDNFFPDGEHFSSLRNGRIVKVGFFENNVTDTLFDGSELKIQSHLLSADGGQALLISERTPIYRHSFTARYHVADLADGKIKPLSASAVRDASFSPDGSRIAFVRDNDLFVTARDGVSETRVSHDGKRNHIINAVTDWVYEEEYGFTKAYCFSPDSRQIAYLRFDESRVKEFSMMRYDDKLYPEPYVFKYPKAGEQNSVVTLHVYDIESGTTRKIDTGVQTDQYIPRIGWTPSDELFFYRVNRLQNVFEVITADKEGKTHIIYKESSPRYVERPDEKTITFLADGDRFIVKNETHTGWMHLYLYSIRKGLLNAITSGEWEVTELVGVRNGAVWYMSSETSPLDRNLYSVKLNGKAKQRVTKGEGSYRVTASPAMKYYRETFMSSNHTGSLTVTRLADNPANTGYQTGSAKVAADARTNKIFFSFSNQSGTTLNGYMIKPSDFDSSREYPVFMTQYSGPGSQSVQNSPNMDKSLFVPLLDAGYIVACVDGRGTGFRGEEFKKCTYGQLGKLETEDQISAARHLASLPYVDSSRIGIYGWSYGGFMALNCILKGAEFFKLAVAVAPVTSWRYYDTIYTEIYNALPQDNPSGYDDNSPINFADRLEGKLLLIHGSGDDNVHAQNSYEMAKALVKAGKPFDMMIYPDDNHSMVPNGSRHIREKITRYVIDNL